MVSLVSLQCFGDTGSGKTSLLIVFASGEFPIGYCPTVFDNWSTTIQLDGETIQLFLMDWAPSEDDDIGRLPQPTNRFGGNRSDAILLFFSLVNRKSFDNIKAVWLGVVNAFAKHYGKVPIILVGNKTDLRSSGSSPVVISTEEAQALADEIGARYFECSAKAKEGVQSVFLGAAAEAAQEKAAMDAERRRRRRAEQRCVLC